MVLTSLPPLRVFWVGRFHTFWLSGKAMYKQILDARKVTNIYKYPMGQILMYSLVFASRVQICAQRTLSPSQVRWRCRWWDIILRPTGPIQGNYTLQRNGQDVFFVKLEISWGHQAAHSLLDAPGTKTGSGQCPSDELVLCDRGTKLSPIAIYCWLVWSLDKFLRWPISEGQVLRIV